MQSKKILLVLIILGFVIYGPVSANPAGAEAIEWLTYDKAKQKRLDRKFFLYFYADWCGYCRSLEKTTFKDPTITSYINRHFIPVRINIDQEKPIAAHFEVGGVPDLRFITPQGDPIARWPGFIKAQELLPLLKYIYTDSYRTLEFSEFKKNNS